LKEQNDYRQFITVFVIAYIIYMSNQMAATTISLFAGSMDASSQTIGLISGVFGVMSFITRPFSGQAVDRENNKTLMFIVLGMLIASNILLVFASKPFYLLLSRAIYGLGWGLGSTLCLTTVCNSLAGDRLRGGIAVYTLGQIIAMVIGPPLALWILGMSGFRTLYLSATGLTSIAFLLVFLYRTKNRGNSKLRYSFSLSEMFARRALVPAFMTMCAHMVFASITAFLLLYAENLGVGAVRWFFTLEAVMILATRPFFAKLKRGNLIRITAASELLSLAALIVLYAASNKLHFAAAAVLQGLGMAGSQPALFSLCVENVPAHRRGRATNTNYAGADAGAFLGPWLAGIVAGALGYRYIFLVMALPLLLGLTVFCVHYRTRLKTTKKAC
jgi:predicted MFS family arabinose efflux permease